MNNETIKSLYILSNPRWREVKIHEVFSRLVERTSKYLQKPEIHSTEKNRSETYREGRDRKKAHRRYINEVNVNKLSIQAKSKYMKYSAAGLYKK